MSETEKFSENSCNWGEEAEDNEVIDLHELARSLTCREYFVQRKMFFCNRHSPDFYSRPGYMAFTQSEERVIIKKLIRDEGIEKFGNGYRLNKKFAAIFKDECHVRSNIGEDYYVPPFTKREVWSAHKSLYEARINRAGASSLEKAGKVTFVSEIDEKMFEIIYTVFVNTHPRAFRNEYFELTPAQVFQEFDGCHYQDLEEFLTAISDAEALGYLIRHPTDPQKFKVNSRYILEGDITSLLLLPKATPAASK